MAAGHIIANNGSAISGEYKKIVFWICTIAALGGVLWIKDLLLTH
jgi:hypothetical protein